MKSPARMLTQAPRTATWAARGAKVQTSAMVSDPTSAVPRNLKLRRTEGRLLGSVIPGTVRQRTSPRQGRRSDALQTSPGDREHDTSGFASGGVGVHGLRVTAVQIRTKPLRFCVDLRRSQFRWLTRTQGMATSP